MSSTQIVLLALVALAAAQTAAAWSSEFVLLLLLSALLMSLLLKLQCWCLVALHADGIVAGSFFLTIACVCLPLLLNPRLLLLLLSWTCYLLWQGWLVSSLCLLVGWLECAKFKLAPRSMNNFNFMQPATRCLYYEVFRSYFSPQNTS